MTITDDLTARRAGVEDTLAVTDFLHLEADLLDEWRFADWLDLLAEDLFYWAPVRENRLYRERKKETNPLGGSAYFEENRQDVVQRVDRLATHQAWAEDPPSRTRHLVSNIRVATTEDPQELSVGSNFIVYRTRSERDEDHIVGQRRDVLRRADTPAGFVLVRREIRFDMSTLLIKNLSSFF